jgi:glycosidase
MDLAVNHLCDTKTAYASYSSNHVDCTQSLWESSWSGVPSDGRSRGSLKFSDDFFGPLRSQYFYSRCGTNQGSDTSDNGPAAVFGDFDNGFFDFDTRNYDFQDVFTEIHKFWIAYADVDGFRMVNFLIYVSLFVHSTLFFYK